MEGPDEDDEKDFVCGNVSVHDEQRSLGPIRPK